MKVWDHRITLHMKWLHFTYCTLLLFLILNFSGCASTPVVEKTKGRLAVEATPTPVEEPFVKTWNEGMEAFRRGDYSEAAGLFEVLSENTRNETTRHRAIYALAATRLILADNPEEFTRAMRVWEHWSKQRNTTPEGEDPDMLTPFLERLVPPGTSQVSAVPGTATKPPRQVERTNIYNSYMVGKELLRTRDKELERMKVNLGVKDKEIRKLKKQITSLEEIHLKFQEKKQELSPP